MKPVYSSVEEYFRNEASELIKCLEYREKFWQGVKANTIRNSALATTKRLVRIGGEVHAACEALMEGRLLGKVSNPG